MKTITLRIPSVEAAMLQDLQKSQKAFRNLGALVLGLIREEYGKKGVNLESNKCPPESARGRDSARLLKTGTYLRKL
jgi:hypothetical protein